MPHALIIDDNLLVSNVLKERLAPLGFDSFESSWTEDEAVTAAERRIPDLVVVGDAVEAGCPVNAARRISERHDVPVLMVTANAASLRNLSGRREDARPLPAQQPPDRYFGCRTNSSSRSSGRHFLLDKFS